MDTAPASKQVAYTMAHVYDSIEAYNLFMKDLERYLKSLFPGQPVKVTKLENEYRMRIPRRLSTTERHHIIDEIRQ